MFFQLIEPPEFYNEINFKAKKHTEWKATKDDFTNSQAPICRRHTVVFPPRVLDEPFKKLLQSDIRLFSLSRQPFPAHNYPHFQNQFLDFSYNKSVYQCSSSKHVNNDHHGAIVPYVPKLVQPDSFFLGHSSSSNLQIQFSNSPYLDEKATQVSYERTRTNGVLEQSRYNQIQEISVNPTVNQDNFLQNRGLESWTPSQLPGHNQMNYMTGVGQSYVNNGIVLKGPEPWLHAVERRVGFDNSIGGSSAQVMNHMPYLVDDESSIHAELAFQKSIDWIPFSYGGL